MVLGLVCVCLCEPQKPVRAKKTEVYKLTGRVASTDEMKDEIVVSFYSRKGKEKVNETFTVNSKTKIKKYGGKTDINNLLIEDKILVEYITLNGKKIAKSITVKVPSKKKHSGQTKKGTLS